MLLLILSLGWEKCDRAHIKLKILLATFIFPANSVKSSFVGGVLKKEDRITKLLIIDIQKVIFGKYTGNIENWNQKYKREKA